MKEMAIENEKKIAALPSRPPMRRPLLPGFGALLN
jgi:hypothetical protein